MVSGLSVALLMLAGATSAPLPATAHEWDLFFDPIFAAEMDRAHVPGAVVAVAHGGEIVYHKGFGTTCLGGSDPVDPTTTLFRVGSLSKLITATCVMQLMEQGKIDLNADVNAYLKDMRLPDAFGKPVTMANLLTHTGGFDDRFLSGAARTAPELPSLGAYLSRRMPPRVMPPDMAISYSNHGYALAGHVVEQVSGTRFADYAEENVFKPLGMTHSFFALVPGPDTPLACGYLYYFGKHHPVTYDYPCTVPASSLDTTADDMARFMIAHLQNGRIGNASRGLLARVLREDTAKFMHAQHFTHHPKLPGWTFGFAEHSVYGRRTLEHTGLIWGFATLMMLLPDEDTGLFVSSNTDAPLYGAVRSRFLDQFSRARSEPEQAVVPEGSDDRIRQIGGYYRSTRYCRTTLFKVGIMLPRFTPEIHVTPGDKPGTLLLSRAGTRGRPEALIEVEPYYFRGLAGPAKEMRLNDSVRVAFRVDESGNVTHMFNGNTPLERIPFCTSWLFLAVTAGVVLVLFLSAWIAWPVAAWLRRRRGQPPWPRANRIVRTIGLAASGLHIAFAVALGTFLLAGDPQAIGYGPPPALVAILVIPLVDALATAACIIGAVLTWIRTYWSLAGRIHYTAVTCAAVVYLALLWYWNLLGFQF